MFTQEDVQEMVIDLVNMPQGETLMRYLNVISNMDKEDIFKLFMCLIASSRANLRKLNGIKVDDNDNARCLKCRDLVHVLNIAPGSGLCDNCDNVRDGVYQVLNR